MADIQLYTISVPQSKIDDLKERLSLAKFPDELDAAAWDLGAPLTDIKRLTAYWKDSFDWKKAESELNKLPQFTTSISVDGFPPLQIHYIHKKSSNTSTTSIPLLFCHGWPGHFMEAVKVIDQLSSSTSKDAPSFDIVVPSLPNFGFSEGPSKRGFAIAQYAETCHKLMLKLQYAEYVTQGGDWGFYITRAMSLLYPNHCKATHLNMDFGEAPEFSKYPLLAMEHALKPYTAREEKGLQRSKWFAEEGSGYRIEQSTKPQTLGYAMADSPVALLAWIYEKLHDWTDAYPWTDDEVCTWVSIYWFSTAGPAANLRIYYEAIHNKGVSRDRVGHWIDGVKIGMSHSPMELRVLPNTWTRKQGNIVFERYHDSGGHFFAWEKPDHLVRDVREMFGKGGGAYGIVKGRNGY